MEGRSAEGLTLSPAPNSPEDASSVSRAYRAPAPAPLDGLVPGCLQGPGQLLYGQSSVTPCGGWWNDTPSVGCPPSCFTSHSPARVPGTSQISDLPWSPWLRLCFKRAFTWLRPIGKLPLPRLPWLPGCLFNQILLPDNWETWPSSTPRQESIHSCGPRSVSFLHPSGVYPFGKTPEVERGNQEQGGPQVYRNSRSNIKPTRRLTRMVVAANATSYFNRLLRVTSGPRP